MANTLVFDLSNLMYIGAYLLGRGIENHPTADQQIYQSAREMMRRLYRQFGPDKVVFACDSPSYWRRDLYPDYKGQRPLNLLKRQVRAAVALFKAEHADLCVEVEGCEADDVIYALSQCAKCETLTIVSSDQDFVQLINDKVKLFEPKYRQYRACPKKPELALFVKCIRGDSSDNIPSAYPYVRTKQLQAAFHDQKRFDQLLNTILKNGQTVRERYEFNRKLIDLSQIPVEYGTSVSDAVAEIMD